MRRKACVVLLVLCSFLFAVQGYAYGTEGTLTLEMALALAREHNPSLAVAGEQVVQSEADVEKASSAMGPKLQVQASYTRYNEDARNPVFDGTGRPTGGYILEGFENTWRTAVVLTQVLYSGGSLSANRAAARLRTEAQRAREIRALQGVENGVKRAYYDLQRARAFLVIAEESARLAKEHLAVVEALFRHGAVAKNEVLRVQVDVSNAELLQIQSENAVNVAWKGLSRAVGIALPEKAALPEPEKPLEGVEFPPDPERLALESRQEMRALDFMRQAALESVTAAEGQGKPQLFFEGKYQDVGDGFYPDKKDQWTLSLVAQWTLYDHGEVRSQAKKGRSMVREFLGRMDDLEKQVIHEVATARLNLESALKRTDVARTQVILAEEDYRMALQRYRVQAGTNLDVLDARVALVNAQNKLAASVYDAYTARADFAHALGGGYERR